MNIDETLKEIAGALLKAKPEKVLNLVTTAKLEMKAFCPTCGSRIVNANMAKETYCERCGQHLEWEE